MKSLVEICQETGNEDILLIATKAAAKPNDPVIDRRRVAWSEGRKAAHAERAKAGWEIRASHLVQKFLEFRYVGEQPTPLANLQHLCDLSGLTIAQAKESLRLHPDGWLQYVDGFPVIYAQSVEACDKLRHSIYARTNNMEDIIHLQKRGSKRF